MAETIEYDWVESNLLEPPCTLLNFGCCGDKSVEKFTKKGYKIIGIDRLKDERKIENYFALVKDILKHDIGNEYKCIYSISAVEHVGLPKYNDGILDEDGDIKAFRKLYSALESGGILLMTFPYGSQDIIPEKLPKPVDWRIYDKERLDRMIKGLDAEVTFFPSISEYIRSGWMKFHRCEPPREFFESIVQKKPINSGMDEIFSVACIKVKKP